MSKTRMYTIGGPETLFTPPNTQEVLKSVAKIKTFCVWVWIDFSITIKWISIFLYRDCCKVTASGAGCDETMSCWISWLVVTSLRRITVSQQYRIQSNSVSVPPYYAISAQTTGCPKI